MTRTSRSKPPEVRTKKPLPTIPDEWCKEIDGIIRFIILANPEKARYTSGWLSNWKKYYNERIDDLIENPPDGIRRTKIMTEYRRRVSFCRAYSFKAQNS